MIWWQLLLKPIDLEWKVLPPINIAKPESVSLLWETSFVFLFNNFSNSAIWNFLNPVSGCGKVWIFPALSNECFGTGGCSRHRTVSTASKAQFQHASRYTPVLMQLALLCVCATVRQHRQSDRTVLKRPWHSSVLSYILETNCIPYIRLFSLKKAVPKILRHPWQHNIPLRCFGGTEDCIQISSKLVPHGRTWGRRRQVWMLLLSSPEQNLSQLHSGGVWILCLFSTHTLPSFPVLKPGSIGDLEQHKQYKTLLLCLFCHYPMNALTF